MPTPWADSYIRAKKAGMSHVGYARAAGLLEEDGHWVLNFGAGDSDDDDDDDDDFAEDDSDDEQT